MSASVCVTPPCLENEIAPPKHTRSEKPKPNSLGSPANDGTHRRRTSRDQDPQVANALTASQHRFRATIILLCLFLSAGLAVLSRSSSSPIRSDDIFRVFTGSRNSAPRPASFASFVPFLPSFLGKSSRSPLYLSQQWAKAQQYNISHTQYSINRKHVCEKTKRRGRETETKREPRALRYGATEEVELRAAVALRHEFVPNDS